MPLPTREELETRYGQMVAEQRAREAAAAQQMSQGVGGFVSGVGTGLMDQLRGYRDLLQKGGQFAGNYINDIAMMRDPTRNLPGYTDLAAMGEAAVDPQTYINMGKDIYQQATGGSESLGRLVGQNINPLNMVRELRPVMSELDVYHGSPHRFPATEANPLGEFDASKIGTGVGAQAYGHGIYLAQNPTVAGMFKNPAWQDEQIIKALKTPTLTKNEYYTLGELMRKSYSRTEKLTSAEQATLERLQNQQEKVAQELDAARKNASVVYKADLPDEMIDRMLDWDKPLRDQPEIYKKVLADKDWRNRLRSRTDKQVGELTGADLYQMGHDQTVRLGIPGIKYLFEGNQAAGGTGNRNFVVFPGEEKRVKILERK